MPYVLKGKCVHKQKADGSAGAQVPGGCHKTVAEAKKHLAALYANVKAAAPDHSTGMMVALYPPPDIAKKLKVTNGLAAEDLHVTLAYMGHMFDADDAPGGAVDAPGSEPDADDRVPVGPALLGRVQAGVSRVARKHRKKHGQVAGLGRFAKGPDGVPVYAPVDVPGLAELHLDVMSALEEAGLPARTDHGYTPHLTLGYHTKDSPVEPKDVAPTPMTFDTLALKMGDQTYAFPLLGDVPETSPNEPTSSPSQPSDTPSNDHYAFCRLYFAEGDRAPDGRIIDPGATNFDRPPPLPIALQTVRAQGHDGAVICGVVTNVARFGNVIVGDGFFDLSQPAGQQALELVTNGTMPTWSPDMGDAQISAQAVPSGQPITEGQPDTHYISCTLLGFVLCQIPALGTAVIELLDASGNVIVPGPSRGPSLPEQDAAPMMASTRGENMYLDDFANISTAERKKAAKAGEALPDGSFPIRNKQDLMNARRAVGRANPADRAKVKAHIAKRARALGVPLPKERPSVAACAGPANPPAEWFAQPEELAEPQRFITIEDSGRVYFTLAPAEGCHIGYKNMCVTPPADDDFSYFHHAQVQTADGEFVATGPVALRGGHAPEGFSALRAQAHYDDPATGIMDVCVGYDDEGNIWGAGAIRAGVTDNDIARLRASGVSGDWREIDGQLHLIGICSVNTPGFPKIRLAASGAADDPNDVTIEAIIGMGTDPDFNEECDDCFTEPTLEDRIEELEARIVYLHELVASSGIEDRVFDELRASIDG